MSVESRLADFRPICSAAAALYDRAAASRPNLTMVSSNTEGCDYSINYMTYTFCASQDSSFKIISVL